MATYYLTSKINLDEALKDEEQSIRVEARFDNLLSKSKILEAMGRKDDATATRNQALEMASALATLFLWPPVAGREEAGRGIRALSLKREEIPRLLDVARRSGPRL